MKPTPIGVTKAAAPRVAARMATTEDSRPVTKTANRSSTPAARQRHPAAALGHGRRDRQPGADGAGEQAAGKQERILGDDHHENMAPAVPDRAEERQFPPALEHVPKQDRGEPTVPSSSPRPPSV